MKKLIPVLLLFVITKVLFSQDFVKFEPPDGRIIHGLGQYITGGYYTDQENWEYVTEYQSAINKIPVMYTAYVTADPELNEYFGINLQNLISNPSSPYPYILNIGLNIFDNTSTGIGDINIPVETILSGDWDEQIRDIAQQIKQLAAPVYLRPGYEFGINNSGTHTDPKISSQDFINLWLYIYDLFSQENVENVAWVWNTVNPQSFSYLDWYPGDETVDWWGINYFTIGQLNSGDNFLADAVAHNKPVMICESCPIHDGGTLNSANWNNWFLPYFSKMQANQNIKGFIYISDPWDRGQLSGWADTRINTSITHHTILDNYADELDQSTYIHLDEYLDNLKLIDHSLPETLSAFTAIYQYNNTVKISWVTESEIDNKGFNICRGTSDSIEQKNSWIQFKKINNSIISGAGSSSQLNSYEFIDDNLPHTTTCYYFLESISYNGNRETSDTLKVNLQIPKDFSFHIKNYPNPFNSSTVFEITSPLSGVINVDIYNNLGEKITSIMKLSNFEKTQIFWQAQNLPTGVYFAKASIKDIDGTPPIGTQSKSIKVILIK